jgi:hypothetical protein
MIKLVRLVSGEELLCDITDETESSVTIKNPLIMVPTGEGKIGVADYMPYTNICEGITVNMIHIMFIVDAVDQMANAHKEKFGGLIVPNNKIVGV